MFDGETLELPLPGRARQAAEADDRAGAGAIPIFIAAIGPKNTPLAAEIADGWIPTLFSPEHVAEFRPLLEEGFARAGNGKGFEDFEIAPTVNVLVDRRRGGGARPDAPVRRAVRRRDGSREKNFYNALVRRYGFEDAAQEVQDLYLEGKRDEATAAMPEELIDTVSLCGPRDRVRDRLAVFRDAGVGTLMVSPMAWTFEDRLRQLRLVAELASLRILLGAFGDPGHAFPMLALGEALLARGHDVTLQTWGRWQEPAEAAGMTFAAAPEYQVFPTRERPLKPYEAAVRAAGETRPLVRSFAPDVVVADILTLAPALAAELEAVPVATLVPHVHPAPAAGLAAVLDRGAAAANRRRAGALAGPTGWSRAGSSRGGASSTSAARGSGSGRCRVHTGAVARAALVATLPQLEYPRDWPAWLRVVGPLLWEPPVERVDAAARRRPARAGRAVDGAGSGTGCCAPRWRASRRARCA